MNSLKPVFDEQKARENASVVLPPVDEEMSEEEGRLEDAAAVDSVPDFEVEVVKSEVSVP